MSKQIEALKLALEALEYAAEQVFCENDDDPIGLAIPAIREALAEQPAQQQEPVAWANPNDLQNFDMKVRTNGGPLHTVPLYTSPQPSKPWVGLTDGELNDIYATHHDKFGQPISSEQNGWGYERAIETKLKEKNT